MKTPSRSRVLRPAWVDGRTCYIPLTKGMVAMVDIEDADLGEFNWFANPTENGSRFYAARNGPPPDRAFIHMHRVVAERSGYALVGLTADHIDGNTMNNRRTNLRPATPSRQTMNTRRRSDNSTGIKGVSRDKAPGTWRARIMVGGRGVYLGSFRSQDEAAAAYAVAAARYHGEFKRLA